MLSDTYFKRGLLMAMASLLGLSGCGFKMRGAYSIPPFLKILSFNPSSDVPTPFERQLLHSLKQNGIQIVKEATGANSTLTLLSKTLSEQTLAYAPNGEPSRAQLQFKVIYQLHNHQKDEVFPNLVLEIEREFSTPPNQILGTDNQRKRLIDDMYREAASQLTSQLCAISAPS